MLAAIGTTTTHRYVVEDFLFGKWDDDVVSRQFTQHVNRAEPAQLLRGTGTQKAVRIQRGWHDNQIEEENQTKKPFYFRSI